MGVGPYFSRAIILILLALPPGPYAFSAENSDSFGLVLEARALARTGRYSQALLTLHRSLSISEQSGDNPTAALALNNIAEIYQLQGNSSEALNFYRQALEKYRTVGYQSGVAVTQKRIDELLLQPEDARKTSPGKRETMIEQAIERVKNRVLAQQQETGPKIKGGSEYAAYIQGVKNGIVRIWKYPEEALQNQQEGRVEVEFTILEDGRLENVRVLHSSGYASMDQEAIRAVKAAQPFHRIPDRLGLRRMSIEFTFNYVLEKSP